jgi:3-methyladenine DNA glycosylase AlkD
MTKIGHTKTAASWARNALAMLEDAADARVAAQMRSYFKSTEVLHFLGISAPKAREIEKRIYEAVRQEWSVAEALRFADTMIRNRHLEAKGIGILLLSRYAREFDEDLLPTVHGWLEAGLCSNWASTDSLSTIVLTPLLRRHPRHLADLKAWTGSECLWIRRAAAVSLTPLARRGEHLETAYAVAAALLDDREDLMHKAVGWLLRECGKTDSARLEAFLLAQGGRIPRTALRYAIERFPPARRKQILRETKP